MQDTQEMFPQRFSDWLLSGFFWGTRHPAPGDSARVKWCKQPCPQQAERWAGTGPRTVKALHFNESLLLVRPLSFFIRCTIKELIRQKMAGQGTDKSLRVLNDR